MAVRESGKFLPLILLALPPLLLLFFILHYGVNLPYYDQFRFLRSYWEIKYEHADIFSNLWREHNEHRLFFPLLIMMGLAKFSQWNIIWELIIVWLLALGIYIIFCYQLFIKYKKSDSKFLLCCFLSGLLIFSPSQWENWLWGWQISIMLMMICVVSAIFLLADKTNSLSKFALAILLSVIASYSYATGLLLWPLGIFILWFREQQNLKQKFLSLVAWTISGIISWILFFVNYGHNQNANVQGISLNAPLKIIEYILVFSGAPLAGGSVFIAAVIGTALFFISIYFIFYFRRNFTACFNFLPYVILFVFALLSAGIIAAGRLDTFGLSQALSPRYILISNMFFLSLMPILCFSNFTERYTRILLPLALLLLFLSYINGWQEARSFSIKLNKAKEQVLRDASPNQETMTILHPKPDKALLMIERLKHERLASFHSYRQ